MFMYMLKDYKIKCGLTYCEALCFWAHRLQLVRAQAKDLPKDLRLLLQI